MASTTAAIVHDFLPVVRLYSDGRVERLSGTDVVQPSTTPSPASNPRTSFFEGQGLVLQRGIGEEWVGRSGGDYGGCWGGPCVFHLLNPTCDNAVAMLKRVVAFINEDKA
ncbi:alpha/beta-Hydrolases superfamily protein [Actinidia rufa]|uniref:Alpha/beta-Hydrolases superfamily protein n=1 Tax=Actinidia rufa TaxID=165716 RepID=A0A7J0ETF3_9ERIC|nr:alpha/beta-Hydrolases superfamily protein [Actinidia rufa]